MTVATANGKRATPRHANLVPRRHWGRALFAVMVGAFAVSVIFGLARNPNIDWSIVGDFLLDRNILRGLRKTLQMTVLATIFATSLAVVVAVMRSS